MRQRKKQYLAVCGVSIGVAALAVATVGVASADTREDPQKCEVKELPIPEGGISASLYGLSPSGEYSAGLTTMEGEDNQPPTLWQGDEPEVVEVSGGGGRFSDVNDSGDAVGSWFDDSDESEKPLLYRDGEVITEVPGLGVDRGRLLGINNDGDIAGHTLEGASNRPFVWRADADEAVELPTPDDTAGYTADINEDGIVVGHLGQEEPGEPGDGPARAWDSDDNPVELPQPESPGKFNAIPRDMNGDWVVTTHHQEPTRWNLSDFDNPVAENVDIDGGVSAISSQGWMGGFDEELESPVLLTDESTVELPLPIEDVKTPLPFPQGVSEDGTVINGTVNSGDGYIPTVWNCE